MVFQKFKHTLLGYRINFWLDAHIRQKVIFGDCEGVQDKACDTFIKITTKCHRQFVQIQVGEIMPFKDELLSNINSIICDLQPQQLNPFFIFSIILQGCWNQVGRLGTRLPTILNNSPVKTSFV